jgi:predicted hydrolase (HD superfamily)
MGSNAKSKTHREIADVILMCEAMKTTDYEVKIEKSTLAG